MERFGRLDILVNNAGRGMKYVSDSFMTEPSPVLGDFARDLAVNISVSRETMRRRGFSALGSVKGCA